MSDSSSGETVYWRATTRLMWITLLVWALAGFAVHVFVRELNEIVIFGFPLGFYMAAQGSLIIFVVLIFWFSRKQNQLDHIHHFSEDD